jgi:hypothetical protein
VALLLGTVHAAFIADDDDHSSPFPNAFIALTISGLGLATM